MNEEDLNIIDDESLEQQLPTDHEALTIRRALRRKHIPAPDIDQEWELFAATHATQPSGRRKAHIVGFLLGVAATIAAMLLVYPFVKSSLLPQSPYEGVQIFSANDNPSDVMLAQGKDKPEAVKDHSLVFGKATEPSVGNMKSKGKMLTLTTPRGKDYHITLADGTKVWMNAESKLEFPETFQGNSREVILHGEAFFEVAKDAKYPFIVKTDYFQTKVLGTSFNVRAYSERDVNVVLVEGSVSLLLNKKNAEPVVLSPNQQATLNAARSTLSVKEVDTYPYTQWRDGFFYFDDTPMIEIMQELGRWYNVNIVFEEAKYMDTHLHFVAERTLPLVQIIRNINDLGIVKVEMQKDAIIVN